VVGETILRVNSFLNHQIDPQLMNEIGKELAHRYADCGVTKIITIESSGIAPAIFAGFHLSVPVIFAKKSKSLTMGEQVYETTVMSYTKQTEYRISVEQAYLSAADTVLLIDDFLAAGQALRGLIDIVKRAGAHLAGCGIVIEKGFQQAGDRLRREGVRVESLAIIDSMTEQQIVFRENRKEGNT
jgi:xanthine phosphoribosyltransferase